MRLQIDKFENCRCTCTDERTLIILNNIFKIFPNEVGLEIRQVKPTVVASFELVTNINNDFVRRVSTKELVRQTL
jgi:hypothetical protein